MEYIKNAAITFNSEGKPLKASEAELIIKNGALNNMDWYLDPFCPFCVKLSETVGDKIPEIMKKNDTMITFHFVDVLNERTKNDDSDLAGSAILGVGEVKPELFFEYMRRIMTSEFHPTPALERTDRDLRELFVSLGGSDEEWEKVLALRPEIIPQIRALNDIFFEDEYLAKKSPLDGETFVPFIFINDRQQAFNATQPETFLEYVQNEFERDEKEKFIQFISSCSQ